MKEGGGWGEGFVRKIFVVLSRKALCFFFVFVMHRPNIPFFFFTLLTLPL